jgi:hypothetical protein
VFAKVASFAAIFFACAAAAEALVPVPGPTSSPLPTCAVVCYYVDAVAGSDSNDGRSRQTAFATLDKASSLVVPGATVYVMSGNYSAWDSSGATLTIAAAGKPNAWISFVAYPGQHPVIRIFPHAWFGIHLVGKAAYIVVDGFDIAGLRTSVVPAKAEADKGQDGLYNENAIYADGNYNGTIVNHIVIRNNYLHDCTSAGISGNQTDYMTVDDNVAAYNAYWSAYAASGITLYHLTDIDNVTTYKNYVVANRSFENHEYVPFLNANPPAITDGNGIIIDDNLHAQDTNIPYGGRTYVANNIVYHNGGRGVHIFSSQHVDAVNNTAYDDMLTSAIGVGELDAIVANDVRILNSVGVTGSSKSIDSTYGNRSVLYDYNVYFGTTNIPAKGPHDIVANPRFAAPGLNFGLLPGSPALHTGTDDFAPAVDFFGRPRVPGRVDRGAIQS